MIAVADFVELGPVVVFVKRFLVWRRTISVDAVSFFIHGNKFLRFEARER
jgi:hypothetical protein